MIISSADSDYYHNLNIVVAIFQKALPYIPSLPIIVYCSSPGEVGAHSSPFESELANRM